VAKALLIVGFYALAFPTFWWMSRERWRRKQENDRWMTVDAAATELNIAPEVLMEYIKRGELAAETRETIFDRYLRKEDVLVLKRGRGMSSTTPIS
jgi:hypothetical protein